MKDNSAQDKFWKNFAKTYWEKQPMVAKNFSSSVSEITQDRIFSILVNYSSYCRKMKKADGFKLYVRGQRQHAEDVLQFLPLKKDKDFQGYHIRMNSFFSDYCLVCDELLLVSQEIRKPLHEFTNELFAQVGFPNRFFEMGLYIGNYRQTPFGVHVDGCGVFSFPVVGKKTFRLWDAGVIKKNPQLESAHRYEKFKKKSQTLTARVGDMTYWPSAAWHIAESDGSFSATWSLGVWLDRSHHQQLEDALRPLVQLKLGKLATTKLTAPTEITEKNGETHLPTSYAHAINKIKSISKNELHDELLKAWLILYSKQGFKIAPPIELSQPRLVLTSKIKLTNTHRILSAKLKNQQMIIYCVHGIVAESTPTVNLAKLFKDLNLGRICLLSDYLSGVTGQRDLKVLRLLATSGAFRLKY